MSQNFKEWFIIKEDVQQQYLDFVRILKETFPGCQIFKGKGHANSTIEFAGRSIDFGWQQGMLRSVNTQDNDKSRVYISVANNDGVEQWSAADNLRSGSIELTKKIKEVVSKFAEAGLAIEFIPSDARRAKYYASNLNRMGLDRIGTTDYWKKG